MDYLYYPIFNILLHTIFFFAYFELSLKTLSDMEQFDVSFYLDAKREMENISKSITPLAAVLLVADLSHPKLEMAISKLPSRVIERIDSRFNIVFQLLENQKNKFYRSKDYLESIRYEYSYDVTFCDFKEVMKILDRSKGYVESLINRNQIEVHRDKKGGKRKFVRDEIINYKLGK